MTTPEIRITGILGRDAQSRMGTDDTWWLFLELHLGLECALAVAAAKRIGTGVAADMASKSMARQLRRGATVTVHAARYDIVLAPSPHLQLINVQHIDYRPDAFTPKATRPST